VHVQAANKSKPFSLADAVIVAILVQLLADVLP
jgi:hypothetical protein